MSIFITIMIFIICILGYITFNLFRKVEKLEKIVDGQDRYITQFSSTVDFANKRLGEIDDKGTFQSDDEIGWFFESVKTLQNELNDFNLNRTRK
jgi:hypothetical protein